MQQSPSINWEAQNIFSQIAEKIDKPLAEIVRLHKYILSERKDVDYKTKQLSSIILKNSQQIEQLINDMIRIEETNRIEILVHDKFHYPELYNFDEWHLNDSNKIEDYLDGKSTNIRISKADLEWLIQLERIVLENIDSCELSISLLARESMTSERQLYRKLEKYTGLTPSKYVRSIRLHKAKQLLESYTYDTLNEVASVVGMRDPHYFSKVFEGAFGVKVKSFFRL